MNRWTAYVPASATGDIAMDPAGNVVVSGISNYRLAVFSFYP